MAQSLNKTHLLLFFFFGLDWPLRAVSSTSWSFFRWHFLLPPLMPYILISILIAYCQIDIFRNTKYEKRLPHTWAYKSTNALKLVFISSWGIMHCKYQATWLLWVLVRTTEHAHMVWLWSCLCLGLNDGAVMLVFWEWKERHCLYYLVLCYQFFFSSQNEQIWVID